MDIFSHGLWVGAAAKGINIKNKKPIRVWLAAAFGVFPDLFAFTIPFAWMIGSQIFDFIPTVQPIRPGYPQVTDNYSILLSDIAHNLYNISHSLFIFFLVFGLIWFFRKKPLWEMGGWIIHIIMDIPSHTLDFYPTPFLWPFSDFMINGTRWGTKEFMIGNYGALIIVYGIIYFLKAKKVKSN